METLALLLFDLLLWGVYLLVGFIGFMLVQLISYRVFKFNIYKNLMYLLIDKHM